MKTTAVQEPAGTLNGTHLPPSLSEKALVEECKAAEWDTDNTQAVTDVEKKVQDMKTTEVQESGVTWHSPKSYIHIFPSKKEGTS